MTIREYIDPAFRATLVTLLLTGIAYPLVATGLAQAIFPRQANGSLVRDDAGRVIGSELIGQPFSSPAYFQPRPSAAGDKGWDATSSGGSNLGPTSKKLRDRAAADVERLLKENPAAAGNSVPEELIAASGSGLDPHLSPEAVDWQVPRVAAARQVSQDRIRVVVQDAVEGRDLGFLGEPRVNVLLLNVALDRKFGKPIVTAK
jgi:K+-transporting ATPase ATPase C chain